MSSSSEFQFDQYQSRFSQRATANLVKALHEEASPQSKLSRLYATQENIQSFCVGVLIGEKGSSIDLLRDLVQNFHRRRKELEKIRALKILLDSNVERTARFIEGWVGYWETILYLVDDAPEFRADGTKLRRTALELKEEGYLPSYN